MENHIQPEVLMLYVYSRTHSHAFGNLKYFIDHAVRANDGVDYYFILQNVDNQRVNESELPRLPRRNAHYIQHENICFDFGSVGWFLNKYTVGNPWINQTNITNSEQKINITQYRYFIMINSSVRGPFFPPYFLQSAADYEKEFDKPLHWYYVFTKRLNRKVKLTGCTISCGPVPHVQSYVLVTDFVGLTILLEPGARGGSRSEGIFGCYPMKGDVSLFSEVASSTRILEAGYMIDCLLGKYQTIDFREKHNLRCNNNRQPYFDKEFEGGSLEPYEVVFIKYADAEYLSIPRRRAQLYERWMRDGNNQNTTI